MSKFASAIFGSDATAAAQQREIAAQREKQSISIEKQRETLQAEEGDTAVAEGRARRIPRGRRLLLAATANDTLGG